MTESEARKEAEQICDEMEAEYGIAFMENDSTGEPVERNDWIEKITAALLRAARGET